MNEFIIYKISPGGNKWMNTGEKGLSSMEMFKAVYGINLKGKHWNDRIYYPLDNSDFRRCFELYKMDSFLQKPENMKIPRNRLIDSKEKINRNT